MEIVTFWKNLGLQSLPAWHMFSSTFGSFRCCDMAVIIHLIFTSCSLVVCKRLLVHDNQRSWM